MKPGATLVLVTILLIVVVGVLVWTGVTLIVDGWMRRQRRPDLAERLRPFQPSVGDEAEVWLRRQGD
jgi:hypothetical protein